MIDPSACTILAEPAVVPRGGSPFLSWTRRTLANGLRVILAENRTVPLVWLTWACRAGAQWDPPGLEGLATLVPTLLREGTAARSAGQITVEVDDLGADLVASCDWDSSFLTIELLSEDIVAGGELLLDMVRSPRFPAEALERQRQKRLAELAVRRQNPMAAADDGFARALYGSTSYGRPLTGTESSLRRIRTEDLAAFHALHYTPRSSALVVVGSLEDGAAVERLLDAVGSWTVDREHPVPPQPAGAGPAVGSAGGGPRVWLMDFPTARKTELRLGHAGVPRDHADFPALQVLSAVLGDSPVSRLVSGLRQRSGYTYHVRSRFAARRGDGPFSIVTSIGNEYAGAVVGEILQEVERLRQEPVPAAELAQAKGYALGNFFRRFQNMHETGLTLNQAAFEEDPAEYFERRRQGIEAVEPDTLLELARRHLHPERLAGIAAGPAAGLREQLAALQGKVTVDLMSHGQGDELVGGNTLSRNPKSERR